MKQINSTRELAAVLPTMNEVELKEAINFEVSTFRRKFIITRMHMRYERLRSLREREQLVNGEILL